MAKKEVKTDLWVYDLLKQAEISLDAQGSNIKEIDEALKTASKKGTGNVGFPEYVGVVKDYLLVIEDKASLSKHIKLDDKNCISVEVNAVRDYAVNGALFYAKHLAKNTTYKKIFAFGVSGDERKHKISPLYVDETEFYRELPEVQSFISFNEDNIDEYYTREVLKEDTDTEKETAEILKAAAVLHEDLRNYGNLLDTEKPLIVSGIMLALREAEFKNFSINDLTGDTIKTDGQKIYDAIDANLKRANVSPAVKKDKILGQFAFIKDTVKLNEIDDKLNKTPLKHFAEFLYGKIYRSIRYSKSAEDYIGRFYGEFMSYSGGDGQTLGIILTPKHITQLFCELLDLKPEDVVFDPCCGTAGFLIAAMHNMLQKADNDIQKKSIRQNQLHGIELRPNMFTIATTNMILRGDGKSNLINDDFLKQDPNKLQLKQATIGMMNPPYSQGSKQNPDLYEIAFTEHLLNSLTVGGRCAVIVPQSTMTGKSKEEASVKANILKKHTLEGVITLNKDTFYGVGTMPCIAIFTAGEPHPADKMCKFINFEDDGYKVAPHLGLLETESAKDKKQHLLDVWFDRIECETSFCVQTTVEAEDEWLHSFYYFNDEIPTEEDFDKTIGDYLSFEFSMIMKGKKYLFEEVKSDVQNEIIGGYNLIPLADKQWKAFFIGGDNGLFEIYSGKRLTVANMTEGECPFIGATDSNNGITNWVGNRNETYDSNVLGVNYNGSVVENFYHPYHCIFSDDVKRLHLKECEDNKFVLLFFSRLILMQKAKYTYGYKFNGTRMNRQKILVPITDNGEPDYEYMEKYSRNLLRDKIQSYIDYAAN